MRGERYIQKHCVLAGLLACAALFGACAKLEEEPDRTGSWAQINTELVRPEGWEQIVQSSPFRLGEKTRIGQIHIPEAVDGEDNGLYEMGYGTYPSLDGSTVAVPMAVEFARQHLGMNDLDASGMVQFSTTHYAYASLITKEANGGYIASEVASMDHAHPVDLIIVTPPSEEEQALADRYGVELAKKPVCYDAFVFITHKDNPVQSLTLEQVRGIYTGKYTNWAELGGEESDITAYQREQNSGSQTAMEQLVMQGEAMLPPETVKVAAGMGMLVDVVAEYRNEGASIGYTYLYYIQTLYRNEDIKVLQIEGVSPAPAQLRSGAYPLATSYYGVIRGGEEADTGGKFLDWMLSAEGQRCIAQAGYIPLREIG